MKNDFREAFTLQAQSEHGATNLPLRGVAVEADITGLLACTRIRQRFANRMDQSIEAIYSFPVPLAATLLDLSIDIGGRKLDGTIRPKRQAESDYEEAVVSGDGAFLLKQLQDGHFQISVGNLRPEEECEIEIRYAEFLPSVDRSIRYRLPTALAPKYGDPRVAGIDPLDAPPTDLFAEYPLTLNVTLRGALAAAAIESPTHAIAVERSADASVVSLAKGAWLDRDFVLAIESAAPPLLEAWCAADDDAQVVLAAFHPPAPVETEPAPRCLCVLVDCSGSMAGDSIASVRSALRAIVGRLTDVDRLSLVRFGSKVEVMTRKPLAMNAVQRDAVLASILAIDADLGGTEILAGIKKALSVAERGADLLLITDGEAHVVDGEIKKLAGQGHRIFTVGVGAAVSEKIVRQLAEQSGGACELVTPNEDMDRVIVNQFLRMRHAPLSAGIEGSGRTDPADLGQTAFCGETTVLMTRIAANGPSTVRVRARGRDEAVDVAVESKAATGMLADALPRILAARRLKSATPDDALALALRYRLLTNQTAMVAIDRRADAEKSSDLPEIVHVPQMMAAGWGGFSRVFRSPAPGMMLCEERDVPAFMRPNTARAPDARRVDRSAASFEIPAFLRQSSEKPSGPIKANLLELALQLQETYEQRGQIEPIAWSDFVQGPGASASDELLDEVQLVGRSLSGAEDFVLVLAFIAALIESLDFIGKRQVRALHQSVLRASLAYPVPVSLQEAITKAVLRAYSIV